MVSHITLEIIVHLLMGVASKMLGRLRSGLKFIQGRWIRAVSPVGVGVCPTPWNSQE